MTDEMKNTELNKEQLEEVSGGAESLGQRGNGSLSPDTLEYEFNVGDKTFMEDPEFFGYVFYEKDGEFYKKPYKEEVVITEISEHLEAPEDNQIKVQNYKTQFDDLFQRITAQT